MAFELKPMILTEPYPADLIRIARKLVWYDAPAQTPQDAQAFLGLDPGNFYSDKDYAEMGILSRQ